MPRHIIVKAILPIIGKDVEEAAGHCRYALVKMEVVRPQSMQCGQYSSMPTPKDVYWLMPPMPLIL